MEPFRACFWIWHIPSFSLVCFGMYEQSSYACLDLHQNGTKNQSEISWNEVVLVRLKTNCGAVRIWWKSNPTQRTRLDCQSILMYDALRNINGCNLTNKRTVLLPCDLHKHFLIHFEMLLCERKNATLKQFKFLLSNKANVLQVWK